MNREEDCKFGLSSCYTCKDEFDMSHHYCCLYECGEHEFCRNCRDGIYSQKFKDFQGGK